MTTRKKRILYGLATLVLFGIEVIIALFVHDCFVRPYIGDVLVVVLLWCGLRILFPSKPRLLAPWVTLFAFVVELIQLTDLSGLFGEDSVFSVIVGATFDPKDLICYTIGGVLGLLWEIFLLRKKTDDHE